MPDPKVDPVGARFADGRQGGHIEPCLHPAKLDPVVAFDVGDFDGVRSGGKREGDVDGFFGKRGAREFGRRLEAHCIRGGGGLGRDRFGGR